MRPGWTLVSRMTGHQAVPKRRGLHPPADRVADLVLVMGLRPRPAEYEGLDGSSALRPRHRGRRRPGPRHEEHAVDLHRHVEVDHPLAIQRSYARVPGEQGNSMSASGGRLARRPSTTAPMHPDCARRSRAARPRYPSVSSRWPPRPALRRRQPSTAASSTRRLGGPRRHVGPEHGPASAGEHAGDGHRAVRSAAIGGGIPGMQGIADERVAESLVDHRGGDFRLVGVWFNSRLHDVFRGTIRGWERAPDYPYTMAGRGYQRVSFCESSRGDGTVQPARMLKIEGPTRGSNRV